MVAPLNFKGQDEAHRFDRNIRITVIGLLLFKLIISSEFCLHSRKFDVTKPFRGHIK